MQSILTFIKSRQFFIQLGLILLTVFLVFFITVKWLSSYTNHSEFVVVPDFKEQQLADLDNFIQNKDVSYQVVDSVYDPKEKPGIVIRQEPEANSKVKHNRTVYLYVTGKVAPQIIMPKLIDRSERQARLIIGTYGLRVGHVTERAADCNGCVLAQLIKGKEVEQGKSIKKGSVIDLVVGKKDYFYSSAGHDTSAKKNEAPDFDN
jgi:beta-lactam-binding protein with PASTA domain